MGMHITKEERELIASRRAEALIAQAEAATSETTTDAPAPARRTRVAVSSTTSTASKYGPPTPRLYESKNLVLYETGSIGLALPGRGMRTLAASAPAWLYALRNWEAIGKELKEVIEQAKKQGFC
jgi:hypothetical protein